MQNDLKGFIPEKAYDQVVNLLNHDHLVVKIKKERKTRHGDYKQLPNGKHQITVNSNLNCFRFLMTLIHEIAHFEAYNKFGKAIKPHGIEWKHTFQRLMLPFLNPHIFPSELLPLLAKHFKNPKASSDTDVPLAYALKQYDEPNDKSFIFELPLHQTFKIYNGRVFRKGLKRRTRYECVELKTGKVYLFNANVEVDLIDN